LLLRDLLGELLSGLTHGGGAVAEQMANVYVFLLQHLTRAERTLNPQLLRDIQRVLIIECETWRQVVERHTEHRDPAESTPIVTGSGQGGLALSDARLSVHA
jgi:flagellin-specific chaperone FliS